MITNPNEPQRNDAQCAQKSELLFKWGTAKGHYTKETQAYVVDCDFTNQGCPVTNLSVKSGPDVNVKIEPSTFVGHDKPGKLEVWLLGAKEFKPVEFQIHFHSSRGVEAQRNFTWADIAETPKEKK